MVGRHPHKLGWGAGMQGLIPLLAAHDGWKAPTHIRMGGWHARCDTLAASLSSACMVRLTAGAYR